MRLITCYQTKNDCYKKATPMTPRGIVVHSTGASNPNLKRFVDCPAELGVNPYGNHWNNAGLNVMVHAFIGKDKDGAVTVANILPYTSAAWGVGKGAKGSYNYDPTGHIQFEICEDSLTDRGYFDAAFGAAAAYCAMLCKQFSLPVPSIVSHAEACRLGYASNHIDPEHWMKRFGQTMDDFRAQVQKLMADPTREPAGSPPAPPRQDDNPGTATVYIVVKGDTMSGIAAKYKITLAALVAANPQIKNPNLILAGQKVNIPGAAVSVPAASAAVPSAASNAAAPTVYIVAKGDTMSGIAAKHKLTLAALVAANPQIKNPHLILVGQKITIPAKA